MPEPEPLIQPPEEPYPPLIPDPLIGPADEPNSLMPDPRNRSWNHPSRCRTSPTRCWNRRTSRRAAHTVVASAYDYYHCYYS